MSLKSDNQVLLVSKYKSNKNVTTTNHTLTERPFKKSIDKGTKSSLELPEINLKNADLVPG